MALDAHSMAEAAAELHRPVQTTDLFVSALNTASVRLLIRQFNGTDVSLRELRDQTSQWFRKPDKNALRALLP